MNKRDEINKKSIIIGITSVAIIAIAIIAVIGIFTIKSHAQEKGNDQVKVALSVLKKSEKQVYKWTKNTVNEKNDQALKAEKKVLAKTAFKNTKQQSVKDQDKDASTVVVAKVKDGHKVGSPQSFTKVDKLALHKAAHDEKKEAA